MNGDIVALPLAGAIGAATLDWPSIRKVVRKAVRSASKYRCIDVAVCATRLGDRLVVRQVHQEHIALTRERVGVLRNKHRTPQQGTVGRNLDTTDRKAVGQVDRVVAQGQGEQSGQDIVIDDPDRSGKATGGQARDHLGQVLRQQRLRCLATFLSHGDRSPCGQGPNRHSVARAKEDGLVGLPANRVSYLFGQVARESVGVIQQLVGCGHQSHELFEPQGRETQNGLGGDCRSRLTLPIGADAIGPPGRGFVLGEGHAVATDLYVVSQW